MKVILNILLMICWGTVIWFSFEKWIVQRKYDLDEAVKVSQTKSFKIYKWGFDYLWPSCAALCALHIGYLIVKYFGI